MDPVTAKIVDVASSGGMLIALGFFVRRWINGTGNKITKLDIEKVNIEVCKIIHGANDEAHKRLGEQIESVHKDVREIRGAQEGRRA